MITALLSARLLTGLPPGTPAVPAEGQYTLSFALGAAAFALVALIALTGLRIEAVPRRKVVGPGGPGGQSPEGVHPTPGPRHRARRNSG